MQASAFNLQTLRTIAGFKTEGDAVARAELLALVIAMARIAVENNDKGKEG